jgi:hypothetical protein
MYKVEKNIEMPNPIWGGVVSHKYPFNDMEVGDSFAVKVDPTTKLNYKQVACRCTSAIQQQKKRNPTTDYAIRTLKDEKSIRVWRTK